MNKAFTREPDSDDMLCPRCGTRGQDVGRTTIEALAKPAAVERLAPSACYCPTPVCEVVYFDAFERVITLDELVRSVYPKDPDAPICPCFNATTDIIDDDLAAGSVLEVRKLIAQAKSAAARCETMSPSGKSCVDEVQKYFIRRRGVQ